MLQEEKTAKNEKGEKAIQKIIQRKQIIDFLGIGIIFLILALLVALTSIPDRGFIVVISLLFIVALLILEVTRKIYGGEVEEIIIKAADNTSDETKKIENAANSQKNTINTTVLKLTNVKNTIQNLKEYIGSMHEVAKKTHIKTEESLEFSNAENQAVKANIDKMFMIRHKIQTIAELILELSEFIQSISSTTGVVKDIAEQTNLLALNAAVEAARAGEHGKGFAVVAGEIRKLADESKQATTKITTLITDIQQTTNSTVMATEEGTKEIESGISLAQSIDRNIEGLISLINDISTNVEGVISSSGKIDKDISNVGSYINELDSILEESYKLAEENFRNVERLSASSKTFRESV